MLFSMVIQQLHMTISSSNIILIDNAVLLVVIIIMRKLTLRTQSFFSDLRNLTWVFFLTCET